MGGTLEDCCIDGRNELVKMEKGMRGRIRDLMKPVGSVMIKPEWGRYGPYSTCKIASKRTLALQHGRRLVPAEENNPLYRRDAWTRSAYENLRLP